MKTKWKPHGEYPAGYGFILWSGDTPRGQAVYCGRGWAADLFDVNSTYIGTFPTKIGAQREVTRAARESGLDREGQAR